MAFPKMLEEIIAHTAKRILPLIEAEDSIRRQAADTPSPRPFLDGFREDRLGVIAEIKRRSPSRGDLNLDVNPSQQAVMYEKGGATAISVLTEPRFFAGSNEDLIQVKESVSVPILRKDFTIHSAQIWEARKIGADAVLLIAAVLDDDHLRSLHEVAEEAGLAAIVEVHTVEEAERALTILPSVVGVNSRNLSDFSVSLETAEEIVPLLNDVVKIAESGIHNSEDALRMARAGYDGLLVGERLVTEKDPSRVIDEFRVLKRRDR